MDLRPNQAMTHQQHGMNRHVCSALAKDTATQSKDICDTDELSLYRLVITSNEYLK